MSNYLTPHFPHPAIKGSTVWLSIYIDGVDAPHGDVAITTATLPYALALVKAFRRHYNRSVCVCMVAHDSKSVDRRKPNGEKMRIYYGASTWTKVWYRSWSGDYEVITESTACVNRGDHWLRQQDEEHTQIIPRRR